MKLKLYIIALFFVAFAASGAQTPLYVGRFTGNGAGLTNVNSTGMTGPITVLTSSKVVLGADVGNDSQLTLNSSPATDMGAGDVQLFLNYQPTASQTGSHDGISQVFFPVAKTNGTPPTLDGHYINASLQGGIAEYMIGVSVSAGAQGGSVVTNLIGYNLDHYMIGGNVKNGVGLGIVNSMEAGAIQENYHAISIRAMQLMDGAAPTNAYGLYVEGISGAQVLNYAIYTGAGKVHFGDTLNMSQTWGAASGKTLIEADVVDATAGGTAFVDLRRGGTQQVLIDMSGTMTLKGSVTSTGFLAQGPGNGAGLYVYNTSGATKLWQITSDTTYNQGLAFSENGFGDGRIFIQTNSGYVGIHNIYPAATLDVAGDIRASTTITVTNTVQGGAVGTTVPAFKSFGTNNVILKCPDGGSWILRVANDGTLSTVTNSTGL